MSTALAIPDRLATRPRWGEVPIPVTMRIDAQGKPDFRVVIIEIAAHLLHHHCCGLCGQPLDYWITCLGSRWNLVTNRILPEAVYHESCIRYALAVCPYLLGKARRTARPTAVEDLGFHLPAQHSEALYLGFTRSYTVVYCRGIPCARIAACKRLEAI